MKAPAATVALLLLLLLLEVGVGQEIVFGPECGNEVLELDTEVCESGVNCNSNCQCIGDAEQTDPISENCIDQRLTQLRSRINCTSTPTFACVAGVTDMYLSCSNGSIAFKFCPRGTICVAPTATLTISPCTVPTTNFSRAISLCSQGLPRNVV